jgi:hypothetical protein
LPDAVVAQLRVTQINAVENGSGDRYWDRFIYDENMNRMLLLELHDLAAMP